MLWGYAGINKYVLAEILPSHTFPAPLPTLLKFFAESRTI